MRRILFAFLGVLLLSGPASATHFVEPVVLANCLGYEADFGVEFRPDLDTVNFELVVTIVDESDVELFRYELSEVLVRDGDVLQSYSFAADWNDVTDEVIPLFGMMTVKAVMVLSYSESPYKPKAEFENVLECAVVKSDDLSWSSLKADFR